MEKIKIYLIAGESSGDYIGSKLMAALEHKYPNVQFYGVGGHLMQKEGLNSLFDIANIAIMGFVEVITKIFKIRRLIKQTAKNILDIKPNIVVTIDSLGFNKRVVKIVKKINPNIKLVQYVAPTVWAWKPKRAEEIAKIYDALLCLLPFEPPYFTKHGLKTYYVGHPIVESGADKGDPNLIINEYNLDINNTHVLLMPGSRMTEVSRLLPLFIESVEKIKEQTNLNIVPIIPTVPHVYNYISKYLQDNKLNYPLVINPQEKYSAFKIAKIAIIASGTASLELALAKVPTLVAYKVNWLSHKIINSLVKIKYASIINIMAQEEIIKELLQEDCNIANITHYVLNILQKKEYIESELEKINNIIYNLGLNNFSPSLKAAEAIESILKD